MIVSEQKFFVATGCSYGRSVDSLHNFLHNESILKYNNIDLKEEIAYDGVDNVMFINTSGPSQGSDYQSDSVIYTVSRLLELGAKSENIYCLVEWSEFGRISLPITPGMNINTDFMKWKRWGGDTVQGIYQYKKENPNPIGKKTQNFDTSTELVKYYQDNIGFYSDDIGNCNSKIEDTCYIPVGTWDYRGMKEKNLFTIMCEEYEKAALILPQEFYVRRYIDNIVKTQNFLKTHNIKYNFSQIYSQFSGWYKFPNGEIRHYHTHDDNKWFESVSLFKERFPNNKSKEIHEVYPGIKPTYSLIDWDNFWIHSDKTGVFPKGGIDEWCIDTYGDVAYGLDIADFIRSIDTTDNFEPPVPHSGVTGHPSLMFYWILFNNMTKNCDFFSINEKMLEKIKKLQVIDSKSDEFSETLLFTSDSFLKKQLNKQVSEKEYKQFVEKNVQNV